MPANIRVLNRLVLRVIAFFLRDLRLFFRYIAVGGASAVLEYALFNVLYSGVGLATLVANSIAIVITVIYLFVDVMLLPPALAKLLQIGLLFGWTFTVSRLIVFSHHAR